MAVELIGPIQMWQCLAAENHNHRNSRHIGTQACQSYTNAGIFNVPGRRHQGPDIPGIHTDRISEANFLLLNGRTTWSKSWVAAFPGVPSGT